MKAKEISKKFGLDNALFEKWLKQSAHQHKSGVMGGLDVDDSQNIDEIVSSFKQYEDDEKRSAQLARAEQQRVDQEAQQEQQRVDREAQQQQQRAAEQKQQALASMLVTSGFSFDGYTITKYSGYISGDDAVQVDRGTQGFFGGGVTDVGDSLMKALAKIRRHALNELKEACYALGCNAVIGVDFDYLTLDPQTATNTGGTLYLPYVFGVTANGNAVIIEQN